VDYKLFRRAGVHDDHSPRAGILCPYTVEEIIDASGMVPFRLVPKNDTIEIADAYLPSNLCSYLRHILEDLLRGDRESTVLVFNHSCDGCRRMLDVCRSFLPSVPVFMIDTPKKNDERSVRYFREELHLMKSFLEERSGLEVTDGMLRDAIDRYNENRRLLRRIYELRPAYPHELSSKFMTSLSDFNTSVSKRSSNGVLKDVVDHLENSPPAHVEGPVSRGRKKRVFVSGNVYDAQPLLDIIEECGGLVVGDDFCFGGRYLLDRVEREGDLLLNLAGSYLKRTPCGRMFDSGKRFDAVVDQVRAGGAAGIIYTSVKFCDNFLGDYPPLRERLIREGIPSLFIEGEYFSMRGGQIRTRIEAFLEML